MRDKFIITISREYGSGGGEIGRRLGEYFNIPCYDKELLTIVAKEVIVQSILKSLMKSLLKY